MKLKKKIIVSFILVFVILCGSLSVKAETLDFSIQSTNGVIFLDLDNNDFTFEIKINDPDQIAQGVSGLLNFDESVVEIDDVYSDGRMWSSTPYNAVEKILGTSKVRDGYRQNETIFTVEGHVLTDGAVDTTIKVDDCMFADKRKDPVDNTAYTDKEIKVNLKRIVLTPTDIDYHDPEPSPSGGTPTPIEIPTDTPSDTPSDIPTGLPSEGPSGAIPSADVELADNGTEDGDKPTTSPTANPTKDGTTIPKNETPQTGTGKAIAVIMGTGILASAVFYIKFSKNNY